MGRLQVTVLGMFAARSEGGEPLAFESDKVRGLLAFLAVEAGRPHRRETLAGMLWPDRPDTSALANLRHTLASLRKTLGERHGETGHSLLVTYANTLTFDPGGQTWVDLSEFDRGLARAERLDRDPPAQIRELSAANQLYQGRFLEGFSLKSCPEFDDWVLLKRESTAMKLLNAVRSLAAAHERMGAWEPAVAALRRLLELEPWDEAAHRQVIRLLALNGQRSGALAQFELCRRRLQEELGVEPEEETLRLVEQVRSGRPAAWAASGEGAPPSMPSAVPEVNRSRGKSGASEPTEVVPRPRTFVARQAELARLNHALRQALAGQGQVALISGEAGSGKTSLAWEFIHQALAARQSVLAAAGRGNAHTGADDPYLPFREMLQMLAGEHESLATGYHLAPEHRRRLKEAFPDVIKILTAAGSDLIGSFIPRESLKRRVDTYGPVKAGWQRDFELAWSQQSAGRQALPAGGEGRGGFPGRLPLEAATRVFLGLARTRPLILFLDDLQWADAGSLDLLLFLSKRLGSSPVLLLAAYRPQDFPGGETRHPFEPVRLELRREFGEIEIDLDRSEGMAFVRALVDSEPHHLDDDFVRTLYRHTEGNPLFTVELLRSLQERGDLFPDTDGRWAARPRLDWERLPARVEAVIAERIGRLPHEHQALLKAASVEGETFTAEAAARAAGVEPGAARRWLSDALSVEQRVVSAQGVLRVGEGGDAGERRLSRYRFNHALFQIYLYNRLDLVERSSLHEGIGEALETLYGPESGQIALQLAWHSEQAGLFARAIEHLLAAARNAVSLSAYAEAETLCQRGLGLLQSLPESAERNRLEIRLQLGKGAPLFATRGWGSPEAAQTARRIMDLCLLAGQAATEAELLPALYQQADLLNAQGHTLAALERAELLLHRTGDRPDQPHRALALQLAGQISLFAGRPGEAVTHLQAALESVRRLGPGPLEGLAAYDVPTSSLVWLALALWVRGAIDQAEAVGAQAIVTAHRLGRPFELAAVLSIAGAFQYALRDEPEQAEAFARQALEIPVSGSVELGQIRSRVVLGWAMARRGEVAAGLALIQEGIRAWQAIGAMTYLPFDLLLQAEALSLAGRDREAVASADQAMAMMIEMGRGAFTALAHCIKGEILRKPHDQGAPSPDPQESPAGCFRQALATAQAQEAHSLELRAAMGLAQVFQVDGRLEDGYRLVNAVLAGFTEGFQSQLLKKAIQLLESLQA